MKIELGHPIAALHGHIAGSPITYIVRNGQTFVQAYTKPRKRNTPDQRTARAFQVAAARHWGTLALGQLRDWQDYAEDLNELRRGGAHDAGRPARLSGNQVFVQVQFLRQCMGLGLCADAPTILPPPAALAVCSGTRKSSGNPESTTNQNSGESCYERSQNPREFVFQVTHDVPRPEGYFLRFDITDAMPSVGRTPREKELRMICHTGPDSFLPLQTSGAVYTIANARFAIAAGQRYGVRVTIVTSEGVAGAALIADLIR